MEDSTEKIKEVLKDWIQLDDQEREYKLKIKTLKEQKTKNAQKILDFMKENKVDNFSLEGSGTGNISRSVRTSRQH